MRFYRKKEKYDDRFALSELHEFESELAATSGVPDQQHAMELWLFEWTTVSAKPQFVDGK